VGDDLESIHLRVFETAFAASHDYDEDIRAMALKENGAEQSTKP
jgi:hypothetical protein